jgi:hypothetical protein
MGHRTAKGSAQGNNGSNICWPLRRYGTRNNASKAVAHQMHLPAGFAKRFLNGCVQLVPD